MERTFLITNNFPAHLRNLQRSIYRKDVSVNICKYGFFAATVYRYAAAEKKIKRGIKDLKRIFIFFSSNLPSKNIHMYFLKEIIEGGGRELNQGP